MEIKWALNGARCCQRPPNNADMGELDVGNKNELIEMLGTSTTPPTRCRFLADTHLLLHLIGLLTSRKKAPWQWSV